MATDSKRLKIFTIVKRGNNDEDKGFWVRIGTAWENKDGSLNCTLDALPVNGTMHIREPREKDEDGGQRSQQRSSNQGSGRRSGSGF